MIFIQVKTVQIRIIECFRPLTTERAIKERFKRQALVGYKLDRWYKYGLVNLSKEASIENSKGILTVEDIIRNKSISNIPVSFRPFSDMQVIRDLSLDTLRLCNRFTFDERYMAQIYGIGTLVTCNWHHCQLLMKDCRNDF